MKRFLIAAALVAAVSLGGCTAVDAGLTSVETGQKVHIDPVAAAVETAVTAEGVTAGVLVKCPTGLFADFAVLSAREFFDVHYAGKLTQAQRDQVDAARRLHDKTCSGTGDATAAPSASPAPSSTSSPSG